MLANTFLLLPFLFYAGTLPFSTAAEEPNLISFSRCGLVNNIDGAQVYDFAAERVDLNNFHDTTFQDFILERSSLLFDLDYCRFVVGNINVEVDVMCDQGTDCVCSVYYSGKRCGECSICTKGVTDEEGFKFSTVAYVSADCSGINADWPTCAVSCDGADDHWLPEVNGCFNMTKAIEDEQLAGPTSLSPSFHPPSPSPDLIASSQKGEISSAAPVEARLFVAIIGTTVLSLFM